jgi:murein DD-endopeptidase MepM/ murein hydrolase activator NlpD
MQQTQNHNRDFKEPGDYHPSRSYLKIIAQLKLRYWLLPLLIFVAIMLFTDRGQAIQGSDYQIIQSQLTVDSLSASINQSEQSLPAFTDKPATVHQAETNDEPMLPDVLAPDVLANKGSGISFTPLLESSPDQWKSTRVKKGDTLYVILKRLGLKTAAATLIARSENSDPLVRLLPGKTLHIRSKDGLIGDEYIYENTPLTWVYARRNDSSYEIVSKKLPTTIHIRKVDGEIISSLYAAAKVAGISDTLIMNMTEIFGWDIDFAINVQPGDRFKLIFEEVYVNGSKKSHGDILAAEFINNGNTYRAIASKDKEGEIRYYSPDGKSMQKAFLRTPVKFSRISSRFTKARYHPVLKRTRAHKGVDYAAGRGTPIRATAAGRVIHAGRKGGYGNAVIISHGSTYSTLYAHMSSFSRGIAKGSKVKQGQTIGRVGSTGLASGPHLHYEFRVNGKHVNPLTFRQPASKPIQQARKADFERSAGYWEEQLDNIDGLNVATGMSPSGS